ncbi:MAG: class I SAM-dependent methyltransferase [Actinobacteria bacterium]|nr:MAG: class I SAM-dependent methyltransferase [Actinomycetota bacterium]TMK46831.1 MAG: class I SAM-dependent methyltransferase [Actinomycetota bacterium]TMK62707.1 MAG: class I SAM-dependent methyltransferase [Actinomycetota bacterium]
MADVHDRIREWWDRDAGTYDRSASHAMTDPVEAAAWRAALQRLLPVPPARVLDVGAGTGALSLLAAELGHRVTAVDLSPGMLDRARAKAEAQGLDIEFVVGPAEAPPAGPFDAVIERHVLWTAPDPVRSLRAWHEVAPAGQVVLFEGAWGASGLVGRGREAAIELVRRLYGMPPDHHAPYDPQILSSLPLAQLDSPRPVIEAAVEAGWRAVRLYRLRDVEWAHRAGSPPVLGWLERVPRYAIVADA